MVKNFIKVTDCDSEKEVYINILNINSIGQYEHVYIRIANRLLFVHETLDEIEKLINEAQC